MQFDYSTSCASVRPSIHFRQAVHLFICSPYWPFVDPGDGVCWIIKQQCHGTTMSATTVCWRYYRRPSRQFDPHSGEQSTGPFSGRMRMLCGWIAVAVRWTGRKWKKWRALINCLIVFFSWKKIIKAKVLDSISNDYLVAQLLIRVQEMQKLLNLIKRTRHDWYQCLGIIWWRDIIVIRIIATTVESPLKIVTDWWFP